MLTSLGAAKRNYRINIYLKPTLTHVCVSVVCVCMREREWACTCGDIHVVLKRFQLLLHVGVFVPDVVQSRAGVVQLRSELCSRTPNTHL